MTWTEKTFAEVNGRRMAYVEMGDPMEIPSSFCTATRRPAISGGTSSPTPSALGRCIAPDLIGMGDSDKLPDSGPDRYRFVEHYAYLEALLEALGVTRQRHARDPRLGQRARVSTGRTGTVMR